MEYAKTFEIFIFFFLSLNGDKIPVIGISYRFRDTMIKDRGKLLPGLFIFRIISAENAVFFFRPEIS